MEEPEDSLLVRGCTQLIAIPSPRNQVSRTRLHFFKVPFHTNETCSPSAFIIFSRQINVQLPSLPLRTKLLFPGKREACFQETAYFWVQKSSSFTKATLLRNALYSTLFQFHGRSACRNLAVSSWYICCSTVKPVSLWLEALSLNVLLYGWIWCKILPRGVGTFILSRNEIFSSNLSQLIHDEVGMIPALIMEGRIVL